MNILAHLVLAGEEPESIVGNLMGDFVKGRLDTRFPPAVARGIAMHRRIDTFAGDNEIFRISKRRLEPAFGHFRAVLVDLFYDHFLAKSWDTYVQLSFSRFLGRAAAAVKEHEEILPERLLHLYPAIFSELLPSYREPAGIQRALDRMALRVGRHNPLSRGGMELLRHYPELEKDFRAFFPEVQAFAEVFRGGTAMDDQDLRVRREDEQ